MIWKATLVLSLALCVLSDRPAVSEQKVERFYSGHHGDLGHIGHHEPEHHEVYAWAYPSYEFSYYVDDPHTHDQKGQHEVRDGDKVNGNYWLVQPDGRKRIVKYSSDHKSGFHADVYYVPLDGHHHIEHHERHGHKEDHEGVGRRDGDRRSHNEHDRHEDNHDWDGLGIVDIRSHNEHHDHRDHHNWDGRREGEKGHDENRGHLWEIHNWGKGRDDHRGNRHDANGGWGHGYGHEEHWKNGVLVGWREGKGDHRQGDDRRGRDSDRGHEDRRGQQSYPNPIMNFKPLVSYGDRLH